MTNEEFFGTPQDFLLWLRKGSFKLADYRRDQAKGVFAVCEHCVMACYLQERTDRFVKVGNILAVDPHGGEGRELPEWARRVVANFDSCYFTWSDKKMREHFEKELCKL